MGGGSTVGPELPSSEAPWTPGWEQDPAIDDGHAHQWETVLLLPGPQRHHGDEVVRCQSCHAPRCGSVHDPDPCMERRHHDGLHVFLSGRYGPVGGILK
jgi:hypothetical protein